TRTLHKMQVNEAERPMAVQIYGSAEASMERAAAVAEEMAPDFIDINCGCWVKKIANRGDGAGLLRDLKKFESVVRAVVGGTRLPVTVKTRLGWDENNICILEVARMVEQCGVQALAVHCRTRDQGYKGVADWSWLETARKVTSISLIGNGDVRTPEDVRLMFEKGCDGVMIGRAAVCNPWLFRDAKEYLATGVVPPEPALDERIATCLRHLDEAVAYKGERRAVLEHRKYYAAYLKNLHSIAKLRAELMTYTEVAQVKTRLRRFLEEQTLQQRSTIRNAISSFLLEFDHCRLKPVACSL
ncbi:MAG: tRNA-dihydrouridine synthase, partial [Candidatus Hydrogenedentes bacterium]|nr:tRNA-dihydrouridine synthase [Candidatus Hydrogenedentota bacterium]